MKAPAFRPHFNRTLGKYYYTSRDYYGDMKRHGYVPDPGEGHAQDKRSEYKPSEWCRGILSEINAHTKNGVYKPSERLTKAIASRQRKLDMAALPAHYKTGGFYEK